MPRLIDRIYDQITSDKDLHEIVSGTSWAATFKILGLGAAYLFSLVVARRLGVEAWGIYTLSIALLSFCAIVGRMGLDTALVRSTAVFGIQERYDSVFGAYLMVLRIALPISLLLTVVVFGLAPEIAENVFNKPYLTPHFRVASLAIFPLTLSYLNWEGLRGLKRIKEYTSIALLARHLFPLVIFLFLILFFQDNLVVILSYVISIYVIAGISTVAFIKYGRFWHLKPKADITYRSLFAIGVPLLLASSLGFIRVWIDTIMLGIFMTETDVGLYNIAIRLATFISLILTATGSISAAKLAQSYSLNDQIGLRNTASQTSKLSLMAGVPIFLALVVAPGFWLGLFGEEFQAAASVLVILAVAHLFNAWSGITGQVLQMTGHQIAFQNITLLAVVLGIVLNYLLIPRYGIIGAAISTCITIVIWNLSCAVFIKSRTGISVFYNPLQGWLERS